MAAAAAGRDCDCAPVRRRNGCVRPWHDALPPEHGASSSGSDGDMSSGEAGGCGGGGRRDWCRAREGPVTDDGTMTYFWRPHTVTVLLGLVLVLAYAALGHTADDFRTNHMRALVAIVLTFLAFGVTQTPDGPFVRPHPAFWRLVYCATIVYELALVYLLFQTASDGRQLMRAFDSSLGAPLPQKSYGGACDLYDRSAPHQPWHNVLDKLDAFVFIHFFGFWAKTLMVRSAAMCLVQSVAFELIEYSLEHQLANFSECWWDHWIMDAAVCNTAGICCGLATLRYLNMKRYRWRGVATIETIRGKMARLAAQFTPYSWMEFDWRPLQSAQRWTAVLAVTVVILWAELNLFYLKYLLWLPPAHWLNVARVSLLVCAGAVATRETFQYVDDPSCRTFGRQSWLILAIVITETLIIVKFGRALIARPPPWYICACWLLAVALLAAWTLYTFARGEDDYEGARRAPAKAAGGRLRGRINGLRADAPSVDSLSNGACGDCLQNGHRKDN